MVLAASDTPAMSKPTTATKAKRATTGSNRGGA